MTRATTTSSKRSLRSLVTTFSFLLLTCPAAAASSSEARFHSDSQRVFQQHRSMGQTRVQGDFSKAMHRRLGPRKHSSSHSSGSSAYMGCLDYSSSELSSKWIFKGKAPACSSSSGSGGGSSGGGGGGSGGGSSGSGGSGGGSSGSGGSGGGSSGSGSSGGSSSGGSSSGGSSSGGNNSGGDGSGGSSSSNGGSDSETGGNGADDGAYSANGGNGDDGGDGNAEYEDGYDDSTENFNIDDCDTYGGLWMWDLSLSCDNTYSLENCECTFAQELMDMEILSCNDASRCPASCAVCTTCMRLLGCMNDQEPHGSSIATSKLNFAIYMIAAILCTLLIAVSAFILARRHKNDGMLGEHLVGSEIAFEPKVFLAPVDPPDSFGAPAPFDAATIATISSIDGELGDGSGVWLAPVDAGDDDEP